MKEKHIQMYMKIAEVVAESSYAEKLKVGAIAVKDNRILSIGYNGTPPGMSNICEHKTYDENPDFGVNIYSERDDFPQRDLFGRYRLDTVKEVIHAEMNLIYKMARDGQQAQGATLFITHSPCFECSKAILSVGFTNVFYKEEYRDTEGINLLTSNNIEVEQYA